MIPDKKIITVFKVYSRFHPVNLRSIPSDPGNFIFCEIPCESCAALDVCDVNPIFNREVKDFIVENYPEHFI